MGLLGLVNTAQICIQLNTPPQDGRYISIIPILLHATTQSLTPRPFVKQSTCYGLGSVEPIDGRWEAGA